MSAFPPSKWDVRFLKDMDTLGCTPSENGGLTMEAFMALRPSGGEEGTFKLVLGGTEKLKISLEISRVLPGQAFTNMFADIELWAGEQIKLEKNSVCSDWWDLEEMVSSQDVVVTDGKGKDRGDDFLTALAEYKKELIAKSGSSEKAGICMRWMLGTLTGGNRVLLMSQALPCTKGHIEANPGLKEDHTQGVLAGEFIVRYQEFDNEVASGIN